MSPSDMYPEDMQAVFRVVPLSGFYFVTCESTVFSAYQYPELNDPNNAATTVIIAILDSEDKAEGLASALREIVTITIPPKDEDDDD